MARRKRFGLASLLVGSLAMPTAAAAAYFRSIQGVGSGLVLQWLEKMGFVSQPDAPGPVVHVISFFPDLEKFGLAKPTVIVTGTPEMTEMSVLALNDERAVGFLFLLAVLLALVSIGTALWAEYRRETTVFLSAGYICGALSLVLVRPIVGLVSAIAGIVTVLVVRYQREHQVT